MAGINSSVDTFQDSDDNSNRNVDFWFGMFNASSSNRSDARFSAELPDKSIRDDQWGHVFEHQKSPKKGKKKKKKRKLKLDKRDRSTVNSASDHSDALSEALSLSSSASSSSRSSSKKSDLHNPRERNGNVLASNSKCQLNQHWMQEKECKRLIFLCQLFEWSSVLRNRLTTSTKVTLTEFVLE